MQEQSKTNNEGRDEVTVYFKDEAFSIHRGSHTVIDLKKLFGIPDNYELTVLGDGITVLPDDGRYTVKGGEHFGANPKRGTDG